MTYLWYQTLDDRIAHFMRKPCDWSTSNKNTHAKICWTAMNRAKICNKISLKLLNSEYTSNISFDNNSDSIAWIFFIWVFVCGIHSNNDNKIEYLNLPYINKIDATKTKCETNKVVRIHTIAMNIQWMRAKKKNRYFISKNRHKRSQFSL